jgi:hypothetical protein
MGLEFLITIKWCTRLDRTKEGDLQKEQKKNRFLQDSNTGNIQNMAVKLEDP